MRGVGTRLMAFHAGDHHMLRVRYRERDCQNNRQGSVLFIGNTCGMAGDVEGHAPSALMLEFTRYPAR